MLDTTAALTTLDTDVAYRLRLIRDDAARDDLAVALGALAAGFADRPARMSAGRPPEQAEVDAVLAAAGKHRAILYDAWYRLKIPYGDADLDSWYLLALALGRTGGELGPAVELHGRLLERAESEGHEAVFAELGRVGPVRRGGLAELTAAVLDGAPFAGPPRPWRAGLTARTRSGWALLRKEDRVLLLLEYRERIEGLEQVRFLAGGELLDNRMVGAHLRACMTSDPEEWSDAGLALVTLVSMWREAGFCLQELNQSIVSLPLVADFVARRMQSYAEVLGRPPADPAGSLDPAELARACARLRVAVEREHLRCLQFDGSNWERREFLVPRSACTEALSVPADLRARLRATLGAEPAGAGADYWAGVLDTAVAAGRTPTDVIKTLGAWATADPLLPVDYAIFTVPMSAEKLHAPWTLDYEDVFCFTAFSDAFDRSAQGVPFDEVRIANAIGQRLRYNVVKKAQNYTLVRRFKAQSFNLPDIAVAEDANHEGHRAAGIRQSCRVPTHVHHGGIAWKGLADIRLNRTFYRQHQEFRPSDIPAAHRLAEWLGRIADAAYERGLSFDRTYGKKLPVPARDR